ncbi:hypothetical protein TVAG_242360 [Trichomonas vaginalis G3]|uniref:Uncharacterized protein n=1 Tax=Trichomonas vaginalis (strain ATCC PRA-98 / G3) TaxID=412133 RepID=A2G919_TRIV3|nr:hypothetical protein TVAG_242360 [Trichomonas vaginalis G3]|eukprot:XP_001299279.1 hypothetical protein [Trichomonas vaginalis G3]
MILLFSALALSLPTASRCDLNNGYYDLNIHDTLFENVGDTGNGGAICLRYITGSITINTVEFHRCWSNTAGACYFRELNDVSVS